MKREDMKAAAKFRTEAQFEAINDNAVAGFVVHKRRGTADPLEQYVTMTLGDLLRIAWGVLPSATSRWVADQPPER